MDMRNVLFLLQVIFIQNIDYGETTSSDEGVKQEKRRTYSTWTSEMNVQFAEIYRNTKSNATRHFEEVKNEWYKLHPDSKFTVKALYNKYLRIFQQIEKKGKRPKYDFKWDEEKYADLVDAYLHTRPYDQYSSVELEDEWKRRHQDSPNYENKYLSKRAREWIGKRKLIVQGESSRRLFEWTYRHDSDLLHIYYVTQREGKSQPASMYRIFADLHPDLKELTADQMAERIEYLKKNPPNEHFPWTKEQNKELLGIYHSTSSEMAGQGQRIYNIWTKVHPRYSFMTPYYLQIHASILAHNESRKDDKKIKRIKFTDQQKANTVDMYRRLTKPNKPLYDFHRAWVHEYPSLAYFPIKKLSWNVRKWFGKEDLFSEDMAGGGQQSELRNYQRRKQHTYTPEEKAELLSIYQETDPHERGHSTRIHKKWTEEHKDANVIGVESLKSTIRRWIREDSGKKGKESMLTPKTEVESEQSTSASDMLE